MRTDRIENAKNGWMVGMFDGAILQSNFEVCYKSLSAKKIMESHYHKLSTELTFIISGKMVVNGETLEDGDIFIIEPNETLECEVVEDTKIVVVKDKSYPSDKHIVSGGIK